MPQAEELLLTKSRRGHVEEWQTGLTDGEFQCCCGALALTAVTQNLPAPVHGNGLTEKMAHTLLEFALVLGPPFRDKFWVWPRQVVIRVHLYVLVLGTLRWPSLETLRLLAVHVVERDVHARDHRK